MRCLLVFSSHRVLLNLANMGKICIFVIRYCVITHAGMAGVGRAFSRIYLSVCMFVCLFVCALTGKQLELSTLNMIHVYSIAVARHALTQRSKGQRSRSHGYNNRQGRPYSVILYAAVLIAAVAGVGLHVDTTVYVFYSYIGVAFMRICDLFIAVLLGGHSSARVQECHPAPVSFAHVYVCV